MTLSGWKDINGMLLENKIKKYFSLGLLLWYLFGALGVQYFHRHDTIHLHPCHYTFHEDEDKSGIQSFNQAYRVNKENFTENKHDHKCLICSICFYQYDNPHFFEKLEILSSSFSKPDKTFFVLKALTSYYATRDPPTA